jgi:hypothetical protein
MGDFRLDAGGCGTVAELLDDPLSGVTFSRRGGRPLDCGQSLDPAKGLFTRVLSDNGKLPAGQLGDCRPPCQAGVRGACDAPDVVRGERRQ